MRKKIEEHQATIKILQEENIRLLEKIATLQNSIRKQSDHIDPEDTEHTLTTTPPDIKVATQNGGSENKISKPMIEIPLQADIENLIIYALHNYSCAKKQLNIAAFKGSSQYFPDRYYATKPPALNTNYFNEFITTTITSLNNFYHHAKQSNVDIVCNEKTLLMLACALGDLDTVKNLLSRKANYTFSNPQHQTCLSYAILGEKIHIITYLLELEEIGKIASKPLTNGIDNPLSWSLKQKQYNCTKMLLKKGADFFQTHTNDIALALMNSNVQNDLELFILILENAKKNQFSLNLTPVMKQTKLTQIVRMLILYGEKFDESNAPDFLINSGIQNTLQFAVGCKELELCKWVFDPTALYSQAEIIYTFKLAIIKNDPEIISFIFDAYSSTLLKHQDTIVDSVFQNSENGAKMALVKGVFSHPFFKLTSETFLSLFRQCWQESPDICAEIFNGYLTKETGEVVIEIFKIINEEDNTEKLNEFLRLIDINQKFGPDGYDLLYHAIEINNEHIVKLLLDYGANSNSLYRGEDSLSALNFAVYLGLPHITAQLLSYGANLAHKSLDDVNALWLALEFNHYEIINNIFKVINETDSFIRYQIVGDSLRLAIEHNSLSKVKFILEHIDQAYLPEIIDLRLIFLTITENNFSLFNYLIELNPGILTQKSLTGLNMLDIALLSNATDILPSLEEKMETAFLPKPEKGVKLFCGHNPVYMTGEQLTFMTACVRGDINTAHELILSNKININYIFPHTGITALMLAALYGRTSIVVLLLENGAHNKLCMNQILSALDFAIISNNSDIEDILKQCNDLTISVYDIMGLEESYDRRKVSTLEEKKNEDLGYLDFFTNSPDITTTFFNPEIVLKRKEIDTSEEDIDPEYFANKKSKQ